MELKIKVLLEKLTQVISQSGMKHALSGIHTRKKQGFYFFAGNFFFVSVESVP